MIQYIRSYGGRDCVLILGIDPGIASTGYGVINSSGGKLKLLDYGLIATPAGMEPHRRLNSLHNDLVSLFDKVDPKEITIEKLFFCNNAKTALAVGEARGVILLAASKTGCPVSEYTPLQVKQAVVGYGKATKSQVQFMVKTLLSLKEKPKPDDAADALAIAICHAHSRKLNLTHRASQESGSQL